MSRNTLRPDPNPCYRRERPLSTRNIKALLRIRQGTQIEARDTQADLLSLERIGKKTAESLLAEIEKSKTLPLNRLLFGLSVRFGVRAHRTDPR
jgi:NAD-dependent DNA ligase